MLIRHIGIPGFHVTMITGGLDLKDKRYSAEQIICMPEVHKVDNLILLDMDRPVGQFASIDVPLWPIQ